MSRARRPAPALGPRSRRCRCRLPWLPGLALLGALALHAATEPAGPFAEGREAYVAENHDLAAILFRAAAQQTPSAAAFHNLGNAEWARGQVGEAILAWERAVWLNPGGADTRNNLRFARREARLPAPELSWFEICSTWLPANAWSWLASVSFWLAAGLVLLPGILGVRRRDWQHALAAACFAVFLLTLPGLAGVASRMRLGVALEKDSPVRLTPTTEGQVVAKLAAGEIARVTRTRGNYHFVRTGAGATGWVSRRDLEPIARR